MQGGREEGGPMVQAKTSSILAVKCPDGFWVALGIAKKFSSVVEVLQHTTVVLCTSVGLIKDVMLSTE